MGFRAPETYSEIAMRNRRCENTRGDIKMNIRFNAAWIGVGLTLAGIATLPASADEWNKQTIFTFSEPVEIPGRVLTPGKYVFQLADSQSDRNIVEVFSDKNGRERPITTILALPDYRLNTPEKPMINFEERRGRSPEAIKSWFYPGDNYGWQFVYPKSERLEAVVNKPALTPRPAPPSAPPPAAQPAQSAPMAAATPETVVRQEEVVLAENAAPPAPAPAAAAPAPQPHRHRLPKTASDLPLFELAGGLLLMSGVLVLRLAPASARN
jgi:hypothetical protein